MQIGPQGRGRFNGSRRGEDCPTRPDQARGVWFAARPQHVRQDRAPPRPSYGPTRAPFTADSRVSSPSSRRSSQVRSVPATRTFPATLPIPDPPFPDSTMANGVFSSIVAASCKARSASTRIRPKVKGTGVLTPCWASGAAWPGCEAAVNVRALAMPQEISSSNFAVCRRWMPTRTPSSSPRPAAGESLRPGGCSPDARMRTRTCRGCGIGVHRHRFPRATRRPGRSMCR
jgi:hypothetical protein